MSASNINKLLSLHGYKVDVTTIYNYIYLVKNIIFYYDTAYISHIELQGEIEIDECFLRCREKLKIIALS